MIYLTLTVALPEADRHELPDVLTCILEAGERVTMWSDRANVLVSAKIEKRAP